MHHIYAHSLPGTTDTSRWESMAQHEEAVSNRCRTFLHRIDESLGNWGDLLGRWHDLGKYSSAFQKYIATTCDENASTESRRGRVDHSTAGAQHAAETLGRQNWLFVGSSRGGEAVAAMYNLVSSAARHNVDVWAYVDDCLRRLAGGSTDYESLLPDISRATHPESIRVYRDAEKKSRRLTTQPRRVRRREARVA